MELGNINFPEQIGHTHFGNKNFTPPFPNNTNTPILDTWNNYTTIQFKHLVNVTKYPFGVSKIFLKNGV